jgi:hypothetical protein
MSVYLIEGASGSRMELRSGFDQATPNEERDARGMAATMDHSSIRALVSAFPHSSRGCLGLRTEIIAVDAHAKLSRIPLIDPAHRVAGSVSHFLR